jgi:hypothetical protein
VGFISIGIIVFDSKERIGTVLPLLQGSFES